MKAVMNDWKTKGKNGRGFDDRCVWMQAGMISYKLCSLDFRCEECELDRVLRAGNSPVRKEETAFIFPGIRTLNFEDIVGETHLLEQYDYTLIRLLYNRFSSILYSPDVQYLPSHLWIFRNKGGTIRVGLDDFISRCLEPVGQIVFPIMSDHISEKATICRLFFDDWNICFSSPFSGRITAINSLTLQENPNSLLKDSHHKGWLVEIKPDKDNVSNSLIGGLEKIKEWYNKVLLDLFQDISEFISQPRYDTGATLADGGRMVNHFRQAIGKDNYIRLLNRLLKYN